MADDKITDDEQEVHQEESTPNRPESRWGRLDELEPNGRPSKRAGFVDAMTGGDDEHPIYVVPTG